MTLYQIDPNLHPDDPMQELVKQWIGTVLVPVAVAGPSVFVISGDFTDIQDMWTALHDRDRLVKVERVGEETPMNRLEYRKSLGLDNPLRVGEETP